VSAAAAAVIITIAAITATVRFNPRPMFKEATRLNQCYVDGIPEKDRIWVMTRANLGTDCPKQASFSPTAVICGDTRITLFYIQRYPRSPLLLLIPNRAYW